IIPPPGQLLERQLIGSVSVHLIRRHEDDDGFPAILSGRLQDIQGPCRIDVEIVEWTTSRQVMARLGRTMHDQIERAFAFEEIGEPRPVSNVQLVMRKSPSAPAQPLKIPRRVPLRTEKVRP